MHGPGKVTDSSNEIMREINVLKRDRLRSNRTALPQSLEWRQAARTLADTGISMSTSRVETFSPRCIVTFTLS